MGGNGRQDHPRRCGENRVQANGGGSGAGSPPQVRGKPGGGDTMNNKTRITPAGAGKTIFERHSVSGYWDHPRRCGENLEDKMRVYIESRITPAGAGKTILQAATIPSRWDHPRRCGENKNTGRRRIERLGSPPQVRGKH